MNCSSRDTRPSHGSAFVARHSAAGSLDDASPSTSGRNWRVDGAPVAVERGNGVREGVARERGVDARCPRGVLARRERRAEHPLLAPLVPRLQVDGRLPRPPVDGDDRPRLGDSRQVEELVALPERLLARPLGRTLHNGDRVADALQQAGPPRGEFLGRKNFGSRKYRLRHRTRGEERAARQRAEESSHGRHHTGYNARMLKLAVLCAIGLGMAAQGSTPVMLKPGDQAPDFTLPGSDGKTHSLSDLRGHTVVLAWFPKAFTGG